MILDTKLFQVYVIRDGRFEYIGTDPDSCDCSECERLRKKERCRIWLLEDLSISLQLAVRVYSDAVPAELRN